MRVFGRCALFLAVVLLAVPAFAQGDPLAGLAPDGWETDDVATLEYNPDTGVLQLYAARVDGDAAAKVNMTSLNISSPAGLFRADVTKDDIPVLSGAFDNYDENNLFMATFGGSFNDVPFVTSAGEGIMKTGLSSDAILGDFLTTGSLEGGGSLAAMDLVYVPEPSALVLLGVGLLGLLAWRRR
jgi:hypothetical protein